MAVSVDALVAGGVCEPMATLGCDGHAVNDTILAHGQLLVDDPGGSARSGDREGPDAVQPTRAVPHPAVGDHVRLP